MAAYAGQNYGAKNMKRIRQGVNSALKLYIVYSVVAALISIIAVPKVLWIFFDSEVDISLYIPWAMPYIIECAVCYFFLAMISIQIHNYYIAVASDPFAWILAGLSGLVITRIIFKRIEKRWAEEEPKASPALADAKD